METIKNKFAFVFSTRFWAMILAATVQYLESEGTISANSSQFLTTVFAGFIGVRTVDRFSEKVGTEPKKK